MGIFSDSAASGFAFKPTMAQMANLIGGWGPRSDRVADLDLPLTAEWELTPWKSTADSTTRVEFKPEFSPRPNSVFGVIA